MKNICFIGAFDKLDLILYIAKILTVLGKKIIVIDATYHQKAKYIVPTINPTKVYITRFEEIDIGVGFESYEELARYVEEIEQQKNQYDYALINIEKPEVFKNFNNEETIKNYFVTSFELYSIKKGLETIKQVDRPIKITKVLFSREINIEDEYYLDYLALGHKIIWDENKLNFPYNTEDLENMIENQKVCRIRLKGLSQSYKESLEYMMMDIIPDCNITNIRRIIKNLEREG